jgi:hypothetical protein
MAAWALGGTPVDGLGGTGCQWLDFSRKGCNGSCKVKNHTTLSRKIANLELLATIKDVML